MTEENPLPLIRISSSGRVLYHNEASLPLLDPSRGRIHRIVFDAIKTAIEDRIRSEVEVNLADHIFWIVSSPSTEPNVTNVYGREITDTRRAEKALTAMESTLRFRTVADIAPVMIWTSDLERNLTYVNASWLKFTGRKLRDELGRGWLQLVHPDDMENVISIYEHPPLFDASAEAEAPHQIIQVEYRLRRHDGNYRWILDRGVPSISDGKITGYVGSALDITDRKEWEKHIATHSQELARSNAELEQFAYVVSHDLQEPLRAISSFLQLLARRYAGRLDAKADQFIEFALSGASRMNELIRDLLAYSRIGRNMKMERIEMTDVIRSAVSDLNTAITEAGAQIDVAGDLPELWGERVQLTQLFQNLIGNAIKYRREDVPVVVKIRCEHHAEGFIFSVEDNGIGIEPKFHSRIFQIFQRLHEHGKYPGTGIGLAIAKKIVEAHGGKIWVESEVNRGSVFKVYLLQKKLSASDLQEPAKAVVLRTPA